MPQIHAFQYQELMKMMKEPGGRGGTFELEGTFPVASGWPGRLLLISPADYPQAGMQALRYQVFQF